MGRLAASYVGRSLGALGERRRLCDRCGQDLTRAGRVNKGDLYLCRDCSPYRKSYR